MKKPVGMMMVLLLCCGLAGFSVRADELEKGFTAPPDSAKPWVYWFWMNGNITKEGITADLEAMQRVGIGGTQTFTVYCVIPSGPVSFLSPEWRAAIKHAAQEADRLGVELDIHNCAGWASSGGPWNTTEHAMQHITTSEVLVTGPTNFSAALPQPPTTLDYYRDIAVQAFPASADDVVRMRDFSPVASSSSKAQPGDKLTDGDTKTIFSLPSPPNGPPQYVQLAFPRPYAARTVKIAGADGITMSSGKILVSNDGKKFREVQPFSVGRYDAATCTISLGTQPVVARFWRVQFNKTDSGRIELAEIDLTPRLTVGNIDQKAGVNASIVLSSPAAAEPVAGIIQRQSIIDLTSQLTADGKLNWQVPAGEWVILRVGYTPTGANNRAAPAEGKGLECDKLSAEALDAHWAGFTQKVVDDLGSLVGKGRVLNGVLLDSYEAGGQNWTLKFREEFRQRRGYDPLKFLPVFTGRFVDNPEVTERFLWDMRRTIADLFAEKYFGHFRELCNQHGLQISIEPYAGPFESLQCGAAADIPMGEFWSFARKMNETVKLASSVGHIYGKPVIGAEAFTAPPNENNGRWLNDPCALKAIGDWAFCQGINRYVFHRYAMQPWTNRWPGMTMGKWGSHFDRTSTWWEQGSVWMKYIVRSQYLQQQGRFIADVCFYSGEDAPMEMPDIQLPPGYDSDACPADALQLMTVKNGCIMLPSGMSYRVLVLPDEKTMSLPVLRKIGELVKAGATVTGPKPEKAPGLTGYPACDREVKQLADEIWARGVSGRPVEETLARLNIKPDFEYTSDSGAQLIYIHRLASDADIYFVSSQRERFDAAECTFRVSGKVPEFWHPDTGVIEQAPVWREENGRITVPMEFDPAGSVFVVFREKAAGDHVVSAAFSTTGLALTSGTNGQVKLQASSAGSVELKTASGKVIKAAIADVPPPVEIAGPWKLDFPPNWGAPATVTLDKLISWTEHADRGVKYFSGTAVYTKNIDLPAELFGDGKSLRLDLGAVKNIAEVFVNGKPLGILWKPPFCVDITEAVKLGTNKLEIKVTNLWPNRLIGDEQLPPDCEWTAADALKAWPQWMLDGKPSPSGRLTFTTWHHWKKDDALLPSGLLGPVTVQPAVQLDVK